MANFLSYVAASALLDSRAHGCRFMVQALADDVTVYADAGLLSSAVGHLLQNAFKFTQPGSEVRLHAHEAGDRVLIDIEDHCGGLRGRAAGRWLDACRREIAVNHGILRVQDIPRCGCVFTLDLPRYPHR